MPAQVPFHGCSQTLPQKKKKNPISLALSLADLSKEMFENKMVICEIPKINPKTNIS